MFLPAFLAAMSSSRSDCVTQFVCLFVCLFVPFFFSLFGVYTTFVMSKGIKQYQRDSIRINGCLAVMSDGVTQSVRSFVRPSVPFFPLVSTESFVYLQCHKASKSVIGIKLESLVFLGSFKGVSRKFQG